MTRPRRRSQQRSFQKSPCRRVETSCVHPLHVTCKKKPTRTRGLFCSSIAVLCVCLAFLQDSGSAEKDDCPLQASGELRVLSMAGVAGAVESTATRTMPPTLLTCSILRRGYSDACERLLRATAFQEMEKDRMMKLGW